MIGLLKYFRPEQIILAAFACLAGCNPHLGSSPGNNDELGQVDTVRTWNNIKKELTLDYCADNYGIREYRLDTPRMIVVHFTVIPTLDETLALFKRDSISASRKAIGKFSSLNVGIHYVIDKDGKIYKLDPDSVIARHVIGFNYVSLGIENVAKDKEELTNEQLQSNIRLIKFLKGKYPSITYLIGHDEYNDKNLPHYKLYKSTNPEYQPYDKHDPGEEFMSKIRASLKEKYGLVFQK